MDFITTFGVTGMTCGHCVRSVKGELGKRDGVSPPSWSNSRRAPST